MINEIKKLYYEFRVKSLEKGIYKLQEFLGLTFQALRGSINNGSARELDLFTDYGKVELGITTRVNKMYSRRDNLQKKLDFLLTTKLTSGATATAN